MVDPFGPPGHHEEIPPSPLKGSGGHLASARENPAAVFPRIPVKQALVRQLVRNEKKKLIPLGNRSSPLGLTSWVKHSWTLIKRELPHAILVKSNRKIGYPVQPGYRILYLRASPVHPTWIREIFFSPSSTPQSCLGRIHKLWMKYSFTAED